MKMVLEDQGITSLMIDPIHKIMQHPDHLKAICDWIQTGFGTFSPGDAAIYLGDYIKVSFYSAWFALVAKHFEETS